MSDIKVDGFRVCLPVFPCSRGLLTRRLPSPPTSWMNSANTLAVSQTPSEQPKSKRYTPVPPPSSVTSDPPTVQTAAIFEIRVKNADKQEAVFTIDLKDQGSIYAGPVRAPAKPGVVLIMSDDTFADIASGKVRVPPPASSSVPVCRAI